MNIYFIIEKEDVIYLLKKINLMDFVRIRASESCRTAYDWEVYSMNNNIVSKSIILVI